MQAVARMPPCVCREPRLRVLRPAARHWAGCAQGGRLEVQPQPGHPCLDRHRPLRLGQGLGRCVQRWPHCHLNVRLTGSVPQFPLRLDRLLAQTSKQGWLDAGVPRGSRRVGAHAQAGARSRACRRQPALAGTCMPVAPRASQCPSLPACALKHPALGLAAPCSNLDCTKLTGTLGGKLGDSLALYTSLASL